MGKKNANHIVEQRLLIVLAVITEVANGANETACLNSEISTLLIKD